MTDFDDMIRRRDQEDAVRGYSRSGGGGFITGINIRPATTQLIRRSDNPQVFEGFACLYRKAHNHKGRVEVFMKGCFNQTLSTKSAVSFLIDHDASICLGDNDTNLSLSSLIWG